MIPRTIHYCWFGGHGFTPLVEDCVESWRRVLPGYELRRWDETNAPVDMPFVRDALADGNWAFASDATRLEVLSRHGGVYLDTDMMVVRSLDPYLGHELFLGFESEHHVNAAIVGARAGHPFLDRLLDEYRRTAYNPARLEPIPQLVTRVLREIGFTGAGGRHTFDGVDLYPQDHFYPFPWPDSFREGVDPSSYATGNTAAIHLWNMSWMSPTKRPVPLYLEAGNYQGALAVLGARFRERPLQRPGFYKLVAKAVAGYAASRFGRSRSNRA